MGSWYWIVVSIISMVFSIVLIVFGQYAVGVLFLLFGGGLLACVIYGIKKSEADAKKLDSLEGEEREDFYKKVYLGIDVDEIKRKATCPKCGQRDKWELFKQEEIEEQKPDSAWRMGGATTVFTKRSTKYRKHYKCSNCGFIKVEEK